MSQEPEARGNIEASQEEMEMRAAVVKRVRKYLTPICGLIVLGCLTVYGMYMADPQRMVSPSNLDISTLLLFALGVLSLIWVPWSALGIRIKKIGGIEVEQIMANQASEHAEEIGYLLNRIKALEAQCNSQAMGFVAPENAEAEDKLRDLIRRFLEEYKDWAFSPPRILNWGSTQGGFEGLANYKLRDIQNELLKMVSDQVLVTRISRQGNTLYRVPLAKDMQ